eukprot:9025-Heterococcus_DN1.PRE.1
MRPSLRAVSTGIVSRRPRSPRSALLLHTLLAVAAESENASLKATAAERISEAANVPHTGCACTAALRSCAFSSRASALKSALLLPLLLRRPFC